MKTSKQTKLNEALKGLYSPKTDQTKHPIETTSENKPEKTQVNNYRNGRKAITGYFEEEISIQLKQMALDKRCTLQDLLKEAFNDLFLKYNKPPFA